jgi:hypothetical protein
LLTFNLAWQDPDGNKLTDTTNFSLEVRDQTILEQLEGFWYIILAIVIIAAYFLSKRMGKKPAAAK